MVEKQKNPPSSCLKSIPTYIQSIINKLPNKEILSTTDVFDLGIVADRSTLTYWRTKGTGPKFIQISPGRILYQRDDVIEWLKSRHYGAKEVAV
jgi:hypothetical protein